MRQKPTFRIPMGILALLVVLTVYVLIVIWAAQWIGQLNVLIQTPIYIVLGTIWILPLGRFMTWMETGRWRY